MGNTLKIQIQEKDVRKKVPALGDHCTASITYEVHTFKKIIKRYFCLSFSPLYLFIRSGKVAITETRAYDIAHDENAMSPINHSAYTIGSG